MSSIRKVVLLLLFFNIACTQTKELLIPFGHYGIVELGGLYGETLQLKPDSTFTFKTSTCLTHTLAGGKFRKKGNRFYLYDIENLTKPISFDCQTYIKRDTQYLYFPTETKRIILKPDTVVRCLTFEAAPLSHRIPKSVQMKGKKLILYDSIGQPSGQFQFFKKG